MKNTLFIIGVSLIILGGIIFVGFMSYNNWNFSKLWENKYQDKTEEITVDFSDILVTTDTSDITFVKSESGKTKVCLHEKKNNFHNITVENGTLKIERFDKRAWYEKIFDFGSPTIKISLPNDIYQNLSVKNSTGDILVSNGFTFNDISITLSTGDIDINDTTCQNIDLKLSTGDVEISSLTAKDLKISLSTGDIDIKNASLENLTTKSTTGDTELLKVVANGKIKITTDTGDVDFDRCDASALEIETDTGDVKGSLLSSKIFIVDTDTGRKRVPETTTGGVAKITTDTGDIIINIVN